MLLFTLRSPHINPFSFSWRRITKRFSVSFDIKDRLSQIRSQRNLSTRSSSSSFQQLDEKVDTTPGAWSYDQQLVRVATARKSISLLPEMSPCSSESSTTEYSFGSGLSLMLETFCHTQMNSGGRKVQIWKWLKCWVIVSMGQWAEDRWMTKSLATAAAQSFQPAGPESHMDWLWISRFTVKCQNAAFVIV